MRNTDQQVDLTAVRERLLENQALVAQQSLETHDLPSLKNAIFLRELNIEVAILMALLDRPADFIVAFKERCAVREQRSDTVIPIRDHWSTPTNQLYWDIATLLFRPANLKEMLAIVLPSLSQLLTISIPDELPTTPHHPRVLREAASNLQPDLALTNLEQLSGPATLKELSYYTLADKQALDVRDMTCYPLGINLNLFRILTRDYPALADQLYRHNTFLRVLKADIQTLIDKGKTPRAALTQLMKALAISGTQIHGGNLASESVIMEIESFRQFFEMIPDETRKLLKSIKSPRTTLSNILQEIDEGSCVQQASSQIKSILDDNPNEPLLNNMVASLDLTPLFKRYACAIHGKSQLATEKATPATFHFPHLLLVDSINNITITHVEDLILLLINFPTDYYDLLWCNLNTAIAERLLNHATTIITTRLLSSQQTLALGLAIIKQFTRLQFKQHRIKWAIETKHVEILIEALKHYSESQLQAELNEKNNDQNTWLHLAAHQGDLLRALLQHTPKHLRQQALLVVNNTGKTPIHLAAQHPEALKVILEIIPKKMLASIVIGSHHTPSPLLHAATKNHESLALLLALVPQGRHLELIDAVNSHQDSLLHLTATNPQSLRIALDAIPENQRLEAVKKTNLKNETVLHLAARYPESLQMILEVYPKDEQLTAIKARAENGDLVLHVAARNPVSLRMILELIPPEQRLDAVTTNPFYERKVICELTSTADQLSTLLELLPEEHRLAAILTTYDGETPMFFSFAAIHGFLNVILALLPKHQHEQVIKYRLPSGKTLLHATAFNPGVFQQVIAYYSQTEITQLISSNVTPDLFSQTGNIPESLKLLLDAYPKGQLPSLIQTVRSLGRTPLHYALQSPVAFKMLLELIPADERLQAITRFTAIGIHPVIVNIASYRETLLACFELLNEDDRFEAAKFKCDSGTTILHTLASSPDILWRVINLLPPSRRLDALELEDKEGGTILHAMHPERTGLLQNMLALYPADQQAAALGKRTGHGTSVLLRISQHTPTFRFFLKLYPQNALLNVLYEVKKDGQTFIEGILARHASLKALLEHASHNMDKDALSQLNKLVIQSLPQATRINPESLRILLQFLPKELRMRAIMQADRFGDTALFEAMNRTTAIKTLFEFLQPADRLAVKHWINSDGDTLLHCITNDTEFFLSVLELYPPEQRLQAIDAPNTVGETVLHKAAINPVLLSTLLALYPPEQRLLAVNKLTRNGKSVLCAARSYVESILLILKLYPRRQRMSVLSAKENSGCLTSGGSLCQFDQFYSLLLLLPQRKRIKAFELVSQDSLFRAMAANSDKLQKVLDLLNGTQRKRLLTLTSDHCERYLMHYAAANASSLQKILRLYKKRDRLRALSTLNDSNSGCTVFHSAIRNSECLKMICALLPPEDVQALIRTADARGRTTFDYAVSSHNLVTIDFILNKIPPKERVEIIKLANSKRDTALHLAVGHPKNLQAILQALPEQERYDAITCGNAHRKTVLHLAISRLDSLLIIFNTLTPGQRIKALELVDDMGATPLHRAAAYFPSLMLVLSQYPIDQRQAAIQSVTPNGETLLHFATYDTAKFKQILQLIPQEDRYAFVMRASKNGNTILHETAQNWPLCTTTILQSLPKEKRLSAITIHSQNLPSVIHLLCSRHAGIITEQVFNLLPTNQYAEAIMARDRSGNTVLQSSCVVPSNLKWIITHLPPEHYREALTAENNEGETALHWAASRADSLSIILALHPVENRLAAMQAVNQKGFSALYKASFHQDALFVAYQQIFGEEANSIVSPWLSAQVTGLLALLNDNELFSYPAIDTSGPELFKPAHPIATLTTDFISQLTSLSTTMKEEGETNLMKTVIMQNILRVKTSAFIDTLSTSLHPHLAEVIRQFEKNHPIIYSKDEAAPATSQINIRGIQCG